MDNQDVRWSQRFNNYCNALLKLEEAVLLSQERALTNLEEQGLIQAFEFTYELAWNVMKDFFEFQAEENIRGSRDAIRLAFRRGLVEDGKAWMDMIESRIKSSHTYDEATADEIARKIKNTYYKCFKDFRNTMEKEQ